MYVLGVDVGTTGTKTALVDDTGLQRGFAYREYPLIVLGDGGFEQRAQDWWLTLVDTVREVTTTVKDKSTIRALSLSTQGGSSVLLDARGEPLCNAHTWMDTRPDSVLDAFSGINERHFYESSGWRLNGSFMAARAVWLRRNCPEVWARVKLYLSTADYLNLRLTGRAMIDPTNAAMTQLFNIQKMDWDDEILAAAGVSRSTLPVIAPSGEAIGTLTQKAAVELGLSEGTLIVSGAHDQYAAAVGAGAFEAGDTLLSTGTAWVVLCVVNALKYDYEDYIGIGNHATKGLYGVVTSIPTAGVALEWCRKNFAETEVKDNATLRISFKKLDRIAETRIRQDSELFFYPQFNGRAFPRWTSNTKASFMGLSLEHDSYDMALAIMEGVAFDAAMNLEAYVAKGLPCEQLKLVGGAGKSRLWTDIVRNVTGLPLVRFRDANITCVGAAAFAAVACGFFCSIRAAAQAMTRNSVELLEAPFGELREHYAAKYEAYKVRLPSVERFYPGFHGPENNPSLLGS